MGFDWSDDIVHVDFGLVTKNTKNCSTQQGNIILLEPTLQKPSLRSVEEKNPELENKEKK